MPQAGAVFRVRTKKLIHFTGALVTNAAVFADLESLRTDSVNGVVPEAIAAGGTCRSRIRFVRVISVQNLAWEVQIWGSKVAANRGSGDCDLEAWLSRWTFVKADGIQATGDTLFYYYIDGNDIEYADNDVGSQVHLRLVNRDAVAKIAGAGGQIVVELGMEPVSGKP